MELSSLLGLFALIGVIFIAAIIPLAAVVWTAVIGLTLLLVTALTPLTLFILLPAWILFLAAAAFANLHQLRQRYIVTPALARLKAQIPTISVTEREAIEAGDTWWEKELFCGRPDWKKLFSIPKPTLTQAEQDFLNNQVEHLCSLIDDWDIVFNQCNLPQPVWEYLKREKFFGMVIPKEYGGLGFSALAHSTVVTKLASRSISVAVSTMVPNSLGPGELLVHYGTDEQKQYYLPRLAQGIDIPCFALTGPDAGSDAGAIPDTGMVCYGDYNGQQVLGIRLSWDKRYITLAPIATVLGLAIHLYDPEHLLGDRNDVGITLCLIPTSHPGVEIGNRHLPMSLAFLNGPTRGQDVFIPLDWIIGGQAMAGQGWRMLMECLSIGRSISLPALATGSSKITYRLTGAYSRVRRQFNTPLSAFEGVEEAMGYIAGYTYMIEACRLMTAGAIDQQINPAIVSAMAKYHMTEMCRQVVSHGLDVHGGHMIQAGPKNFLANIYAAIPISITVEGANILTRNLIIFGQGAIRCHPYLLKEVELMTAKNTSIPELDKTLMAHVGFFASNLLRSLAYGLTGGQFIMTRATNPRIKKLKRQITRMSTALALLADASLILLGGSLKRRENISARLGDILSQLYLASAVLKYYHDHQKPQSDVDYVCWCLQECLYKIQVACDKLLDNFPQRVVGKLLHWIVFPFGNAYQPPKDKLHKQLVTAMTTSSDFRNRLTQYCYVKGHEDDLGHQLDQALDQLSTIEPLQKKLHKGLHDAHIPSWLNMSERLNMAVERGVLTTTEAQTLQHYERLRQDIIKVNEFSFDLNEVIV